MKTSTLQVPKNAIETEAEDHAAETRFAVTHHGKELHPEKAGRRAKVSKADRPVEPWQVD